MKNTRNYHYYKHVDENTIKAKFTVYQKRQKKDKSPKNIKKIPIYRNTKNVIPTAKKK